MINPGPEEVNMATITQALTGLTPNALPAVVVIAVALTPLVYAFGYTIEKVGFAIQAIGPEIRAWLDRRRHDPAQGGRTDASRISDAPAHISPRPLGGPDPAPEATKAPPEPTA